MVCVGSREIRDPRPPPIGSWLATICWESAGRCKPADWWSTWTPWPSTLCLFILFFIRTDAIIRHKQQQSAPKNWAAAFSSSSPHHCLSPLPGLQQDPEWLLTVRFCSKDVLSPPVWASVSCSCAQNWAVMQIWAVDSLGCVRRWFIHFFFAFSISYFYDHKLKKWLQT